MISYEEPITELAPEVEDEHEEDEYAVEEMLMDDAVRLFFHSDVIFV